MNNIDTKTYIKKLEKENLYLKKELLKLRNNNKNLFETQQKIIGNTLTELIRN